jgi:hypothetical protein
MPGQIEMFSTHFTVLIFDSLFCLIAKRKEYRHDYIQKPIVILFFQNSSELIFFDMCGCINSLNIHFKPKYSQAFATS